MARRARRGRSLGSDRQTDDAKKQMSRRATCQTPTSKRTSERACDAMSERTDDCSPWASPCGSPSSKVSPAYQQVAWSTA